MEDKTCIFLVEGKECGLPATPTEKGSNIYQCPLGHQSLFLPVPVEPDPLKDV
jgi:hypothetical protein